MLNNVIIILIILVVVVVICLRRLLRLLLRHRLVGHLMLLLAAVATAAAATAATCSLICYLCLECFCRFLYDLCLLGVVHYALHTSHVSSVVVAHCDGVVLHFLRWCQALLPSLCPWLLFVAV